MPDKLPPFGLSLKKFTATYEPNHERSGLRPGPGLHGRRHLQLLADVAGEEGDAEGEQSAERGRRQHLPEQPRLLADHHGPGQDRQGDPGPPAGRVLRLRRHGRWARGSTSSRTATSTSTAARSSWACRASSSPTTRGRDGSPGSARCHLSPTAWNPALVLSAYSGDLGTNPGVYTMNVSNAQRVKLPNAVDPTNPAVVLTLDKGKNTVALPDGDRDHRVRRGEAVGAVRPQPRPVEDAGLRLGRGHRRGDCSARWGYGAAGCSCGSGPVERDPDQGTEQGGVMRVEVAGLARAEDARLRDEVRGVGRGLRPPKAGVQK